MTYNIHRWEGRDRRLDVARLAGVIRGNEADVVNLNEVLHPVQAGGRRLEPLAELASELGMEYRFGPSGWQDDGPEWQGPVGNAILSRYPLDNISNVMLPRLPFTKQRSLLSATIGAGPARGLAGPDHSSRSCLRGYAPVAGERGAGSDKRRRPAFHQRRFQHPRILWNPHAAPLAAGAAAHAQGWLRRRLPYGRRRCGAHLSSGQSPVSGRLPVFSAALGPGAEQRLCAGFTRLPRGLGPPPHHR